MTLLKLWKFLKDRETNLPPEQSLFVAQQIKEAYCYVCADLAKEFNKYDTDPEKYIKQWSGKHGPTNTVNIQQKILIN